MRTPGPLRRSPRVFFLLARGRVYQFFMWTLRNASAARDPIFIPLKPHRSVGPAPPNEDYFHGPRRGAHFLTTSVMEIQYPKLWMWPCRPTRISQLMIVSIREIFIRPAAPRKIMPRTSGPLGPQAMFTKVVVLSVESLLNVQTPRRKWFLEIALLRHRPPAGHVDFDGPRRHPRPTPLAPLQDDVPSWASTANEQYVKRRFFRRSVARKKICPWMQRQKTPSTFIWDSLGLSL